MKIEALKIYYNGIKINGGRLVRCHYSPAEGGAVTIYAKDYGNALPRELFAVENGTDSMTDYFEKDRATVPASHPLHRFFRWHAVKNICTGKSWRTPTEEIRAEFAATIDPGQPTAADLAAVEQMNTARESARIAAEHAAKIAERERVLNARATGRQYIESITEQHPVEDGTPTVEVPFSENPAFYSWTESEDRTKTTITVHDNGETETKTEIIAPRRRLIMSIQAAEIVFRHFDEQRAAEGRGYDKTDFVINYADPTTGEPSTYEGRYDLGDRAGGLIAHIRCFGEWANNSEVVAFADWLNTFTACTAAAGF